MASEDGPLNYMPGSPANLLGEFPPIPGLFVVSQTSYSTSDALYDHKGDKEEIDFSLDAWAQTFRFLYSYSDKLWGANAYSQLVLPLVSVDGNASVDTHSPAGVISIFDEKDSGLGNPCISPIILNWQNRESHHYYTVGLDIALESLASYDKDKSVNAGTGYTSIMPVVAYRYDNKPNGLDLGIKGNLLFNLENSDTDYQSGNMVCLEFVGGWNFGGLKAGVVGAYTRQYQDDRQNGSDLADSKMETLVMGPSLAYSKGPFIININYQKGVLTKNAPESDIFWLNIALPLYVPPSARPH